MNRVEQNVMASVRMIYTVRRLASVTALKFYALAVSAVGLVALVSIPHVVDNFVKVMGGGVESTLTFMLTAVLDTTIVVQLVLLLGVCATTSLLAPVFGGSRRFA